MKILIGADIVPTKRNIDLFTTDIEKLLEGGLYEQVKDADYRIFNLETPLTEEKTPIDKRGPKLISPPSIVKGYTDIGVDLFTLANNHVLDQDEQGLFSTIEILDKAGISHIGAAKTPKEAAKPYFFECEGKKIGVYGCSEHEFTIVSDKRAGANPFDPLYSFDHISDMKEKCDRVIVLYHGGKEHYRYPSPNLQRVCRRFIDKGADLVVCQHSHCIGCEEKYGGGTIVYGQGNFLFDFLDHECWQTGLAVVVNNDFEISYLPIMKNGEKAKLADGADAEKILGDFYKRSKDITDPDFVCEEYGRFAQTLRESFLLLASSTKRSFFKRALNKLTGHKYIKWYLNRKYKKDDLLALINITECESTREVFLRSIKNDESK